MADSIQTPNKSPDVVEYSTRHHLHIPGSMRSTHKLMDFALSLLSVYLDYTLLASWLAMYPYSPAGQYSVFAEKETLDSSSRSPRLIIAGPSIPASFATKLVSKARIAPVWKTAPPEVAAKTLDAVKFKEELIYPRPTERMIM